MSAKSKSRASDERGSERQAQEIKQIAAPKVDPLYLDVHRDTWISRDAKGRFLALIRCRLRESAERYGAHENADHDSVVSVGELLTERLWSEASRAKIARMMLQPVVPARTPGAPAFSRRQTLQYSRARIAREVLDEFNREASALPVVEARSEEPESAQERRQRLQRETGAVEAWERKLAEGVTKDPQRNLRRLFGRVIDDMSAAFRPRPSKAQVEADDPAYERFGETIEAYRARLTEAGFAPARVAKRVADREAQLGAGAA